MNGPKVKPDRPLEKVYKQKLVNLINEYIQEHNKLCPYNRRPMLKPHEIELIITRDPDQALAKDAHRCVGIRPESHLPILDSILFELKTEGKVSAEEYLSATNGDG